MRAVPIFGNIDSYLKYIQPFLDRLIGRKLISVKYDSHSWEEGFLGMSLLVADLDWEGIQITTETGESFALFANAFGELYQGCVGISPVVRPGFGEVSNSLPEKIHAPQLEKIIDQPIELIEILFWTHQKYCELPSPFWKTLPIGLQLKFANNEEVFILNGEFEDFGTDLGEQDEKYGILEFGELLILFNRDVFEKFKMKGVWQDLSSEREQFSDMKILDESLVPFLPSHGWYATLSIEENESLGIIEKLDAREIEQFGTDQVVKMNLVGNRVPLPDYDPPEHHPGDGSKRIVEPNGEEDWQHILKWSSGFGFNSGVAGPPMVSSYYLIVSKSFREVAQEYLLPPHEFIPVSLKHEVTGEKREYYIFNYLLKFRNQHDVLRWEETAFVIQDHYDDSLAIRFPKGTVKNAVAFWQLIDDKRDDFSKYRYPKATFPYFYLNAPYDLFFASKGFCVSKELADALRKRCGEEILIPSREVPIVGHK